MAHSEEPRMDELKKLLRRLDGLDGTKTQAKKAQQESKERGYVGALRGTPGAAGDAPPPSAPPEPKEAKASGSAVYVAAATAAIISTVTVYLMLTWQNGPGERGAGPLPQPDRVVPSKLEFTPPPAGEIGSGQRGPAAAPHDLVQRAELLLEKGEIAAARVLLRQAAEQGSGAAALKLGHTYDPTQAKTPTRTDGQANPALAKAWYERALALGTQEAAGYISGSGGR